MELFFKEFVNSFTWEADGSSYMWLILVMLLIGIGISAERYYYIAIRSNIDANKFMGEIRKLVASGNMKRAVELCEKGKDRALVYIVLQGLKKAEESKTLDFRAIQNAVDEGTLETIPKLQQRTPYISMLANVATLFGLMGTIYGLIIAFASVGSAGIPEAEKSKFLAKGISAAMQTTILGLATAIPLTVVYTIIVAQTAKIIDELDEHLVKLINLMTGNR